MKNKLSFVRAAAACLLALTALSAFGDEASVKKAVETQMPGGKVESVTKSPLPGLYEVNVSGAIIYTDEKASYFLTGYLYDAKTQKNLTENSLRQYYAQQYAKLPLDLAVKTVRGKGSRVLVTFEDPYCSFCKKLAKELQNVNDVTVYTFLLPIFGKDSEDKSQAIFCSADRSKAWYNWMVNDKEPAVAKGDCKLPLERMKELGNKFRIRGTPALLFASGELVPGYVAGPALEEKLGKVAVK